jgi:hypothetical protein
MNTFSSTANYATETNMIASYDDVYYVGFNMGGGTYVPDTSYRMLWGIQKYPSICCYSARERALECHTKRTPVLLVLLRNL